MDSGPIRTVLDWISTELSASLSDERVWLSFAIALGFGAVCAVGGAWIARRVGLLDADAPVGETLGIGLGSGLLVLASLWAAIFSGGRSSFTPVAVAFAIAIVVWRRPQSIGAGIGSRSASPTVDLKSRGTKSGRSIFRVALVGAAFVVLVGLLYGVTMAPSPRAGLQPVEFTDEAYYSVLGAHLAETGTESIYSPSGFEELSGLSAQTWYHWGELWLSAAVITVTGTEPLFARHYVVLPAILLAVAALSGTLVRRLTGTSSRGPFVFGAAAALFLAPVPWPSPFELPLPGPFFSTWARSLIFGITQYGLATIAAPLGLYVLAVHQNRAESWRRLIFSGAVIASVVPTHIVIAALAAVGAFGVTFLSLATVVARTREWPSIPAKWRRLLAVIALISTATITWGIITWHGVGTSGLSATTLPFNDSWRESMLHLSLGAGAFLAIPIAWFSSPRKDSVLARFLAGTMVLLVVGAVAWGARLGDFNVFHVLFAELPCSRRPWRPPPSGCYGTH